MLEDLHFSTILIATLRNAPVLIFAAMAGLLAERSGVVDLALEGKMLCAAFVSASLAAATGNPWLGIAAGILATLVVALLQAWVSVTQKGNQLVAGIAINLAVSGLSFVLAQYFFAQGGRTPDLGDARLSVWTIPGADHLAQVPVLGWLLNHFIGGHTVLVYLALLCIPLMHYLIYHTRLGLRLRAVGENPHAADAAGISVNLTRYSALAMGSVLCALSGAYLSIVQSGFFLRDMSAGNGYLALTALVFGSWRPLQTALGCLMFGFFGALQVQMEGIEFPGIGKIPGSLIQMIPYVVTVIVLAGWMARSVAPKALGTAFEKSR